LAKSPVTGKSRIALVGEETLLGKELSEVLNTRATASSLLGFSASGEGNFGEADGEAVYLEPLNAESLRDVRALVVAGSDAGARKSYELVKQANGALKLIDCTGLLENEPEARIVAPLVVENSSSDSWLQIIAHPASNALAMVLQRLQRYQPIKQSLAHVFEPVSEIGQKGISELHEQTTSLLAFKGLKKELFDAQLSFNLLARYGSDARVNLGDLEQRVERHLATILGSNRSLASIPMPSIRAIAAPVFHGYSVSLWVEFETDIDAVSIEEALASARIEVRGREDTAPDAVGVAGQSELIAGDVRVDHNNAHAVWIWFVGDNLRLTAEATAEILQSTRSGAV
jgi:aspartate-semialdehyde dehydrogenase